MKGDNETEKRARNISCKRTNKKFFKEISFGFETIVFHIPTLLKNEIIKLFN